jgi:hypothetical protein
MSKTAITSPELAPLAFTYWEHFNETSANSDVRGRSYQWGYLGGVLFRTFCDPAARSPVTSADAGESWPAARSRDWKYAVASSRTDRWRQDQRSRRNVKSLAQQN